MSGIEDLISEALPSLTCSITVCFHFAQFGVHKPTHCRTHTPPDDMRFHEFDMTDNIKKQFYKYLLHHSHLYSNNSTCSYNQSVYYVIATIQSCFFNNKFPICK